MKFAIFILIIFFNFYLIAEDALSQSPLQLNLLIKEVLKRNQDIAAAQLRIQAAAEVVPRVQVVDDPEFRFMSDYNNFKSNSQFMPMLSYEISQTFQLAGKLGLKGKIAGQVLEQVKDQKNAITQDLILETKKLYFQLFFNNIFFEVNRNNQEILSRLVEDSLSLYKSGISGYEEVLRFQTELELLKSQLLTIEAEHSYLIAILNAILNRAQDQPVGKPVIYFRDHDDFDPRLLEITAIKYRPEFQIVKANILEQEFAAKLAKREYIPDVTVAGIYEQMRKDTRDNAWGASISFKIPLWVNQRQKREVREAETRAQANRNSLLSMEERIKAQIQEILAKLKSVKERLSLYETGLIPKTFEAFKSAEIRYKTGKGGFLTLLDTRRQCQNIELEYQQIKTEKEILLSELERAIGISLEEVR